MQGLRLYPLTLAIVAGVGFASSAESATLAQGVDTVFSEYNKPDSPGCALSVIRDGRIAYSKGFGLASLEHKLPIDPQRTVFDIGSTSKQFTAASVLLLVQDGKLSLDDDIRKVLPEIPDYGHTITVRHLLHHTSGLRDYIALMNLGGIHFEDFTTDAQALAVIARQQALDFVPGTEHSYSNTGYFLLSVIVQRVSGKPLREFAQERIFAPLGMKDTRILDDHTAIIANRATAYGANPEGGFAVRMSDWEQTGDGAVQTTVRDLAKWDQNFYTPKVGGTWLIEQLQTRGQLANGESIGYAGGLMMGELNGQPMVSHGGAWAGYRAELIRLPEQKLSVAVLCNVDSSDPSALARQVAELYLGDKRKSEGLAVSKMATSAPSATPATTASATATAAPAVVTNPERFTGMYWSRKSGLVRHIQVRDGKLWYVRSEDNASELTALDGDRLLMLGTPNRTELKFSLDMGSPRKLQLIIGDNDNTEFEEVKPFAPSAAELALYAATYQSDELDTKWRFAVKDGALTLLQARGPDMPLQPAFADSFTVSGLLVRFLRDNAQHITGLAVDAGRAQDLKFVKLSE
ncbi:MAG: serine hydrolase domain-containing protein [Pseudomonadota bacterium]